LANSSVVDLSKKLNGSLGKRFQRAEPILKWSNVSNEPVGDEFFKATLPRLSGHNLNGMEFFEAEFSFPNQLKRNHISTLIQFVSLMQTTRGVATGDRDPMFDMDGTAVKEAGGMISDFLELGKEHLEIGVNHHLGVYRLLTANFGEPIECGGIGYLDHETSTPVLEHVNKLAFSLSGTPELESLYVDQSSRLVVIISLTDMRVSLEVHSKAGEILGIVFWVELLKHLSENKHIAQENRIFASDFAKPLIVDSPYLTYKKLAKSSSKRASLSKSTKKLIHVRASIFHSIVAIECLTNLLVSQLLHTTDQQEYARNLMVNADIRVKLLFVGSQRNIFSVDPFPVNGVLWKNLMKVFNFRNKFMHGSYPDTTTLNIFSEGPYEFALLDDRNISKLDSMFVELNYQTTRELIGIVSQFELALQTNVNDEYKALLDSCIGGINVASGPALNSLWT
jgi:hypothetical protein